MHPYAYKTGELAALEAFGVKEAGLFRTGVDLVSKGLKWGGRLASTIPVVGNLAGAAMGGIGGAMQGFAAGEGLKGAIVRGGLNAGANMLPGGAGIAAGIGADMAANKIMAPKQQPVQQPGLLGSHLPYGTM